MSLSQFTCVTVLILITVLQLLTTVSGATLIPINAVVHRMGESDVRIGCYGSKDQKVTWIKDGEKLEVADEDDKDSDDSHYVVEPANNTLVIKYIGVDDIGPYACRVGNDTATAYVYAMPYAKTVKSVDLYNGNKLELSCYVWGYPKPSITWFREEQLLEFTKDKISFGNSSTAVGGKLEIEDMQYDEYSYYHCSAGNEYGTYNTSTIVRVKSKFSAIYPAIGIVIQLVLLALIIFFYERQRKKTVAAEKRKEDEFNRALEADTSDGARKRKSKASF